MAQRPQTPICYQHRALPVILIISAALAACAAQPSSEHRQPCPQEKPDACTMEYDPVIGYDADGEDQGVFSNHCSACSEDGIDYTVPKNHAGD